MGGWVGGVGRGGMVVDCDMGGPVQIECLGVEPNECSTQLVATAVDERPPQPNCSSRNYPSMFHFVIRVLSVSNLRRSNLEMYCKEIL